jgi:hypothetical protein
MKPIKQLVSSLLGWWQSTRGAEREAESGPVDGPASASAPPACIQAAAQNLESVAIGTEASPVYVLFAVRPCGCGNPACAGRTFVCRAFTTRLEGETFARELAVGGFAVDLLRTPRADAPRRYAEPVLGYRPSLAGPKAIGVG